MIKENNILLTIGYAVAWIATTVAVIFAIKYTGSAWCLWAFVFPLGFKLSFSNKHSNDEDTDEITWKTENNHMKG
jgi:hypothetical protein